MIKHPMILFVILTLLSYLFFVFGIAALSKPIPASLVAQYMGIAVATILLYIASNETRWSAFKQPIYHVLLGSSKTYRSVRSLLFVVLPLFVGLQAYNQFKPDQSAPPPFRTVHPANPERISFDGKDMDLTTLTNPLREDEANEPQHLETGKRVYYERCFYCHGDTWAGDGHFATGFVPKPAKFTGDGTLAILTEAYVFWRIAKGGPGLPSEATPWDSAMPAWEGRLTEEEIWAVIMYLYDAIEKEPRAMAEHGGEEGH